MVNMPNHRTNFRCVWLTNSRNLSVDIPSLRCDTDKKEDGFQPIWERMRPHVPQTYHDSRSNFYFFFREAEIFFD